MSDVEQVVAALRARWREIGIEQIRVKHPGADDDGLWSVGRCRLESSSHDFPFLFESDLAETRHVAIDLDEVLMLVDSVVRGTPPNVPRMQPPTCRTAEDAIEWLARRGAHPWLVRHHELVLEAGDALLAALGPLASRVDRPFVRIGAALHDVGKLMHPDEMRAPGHRHERSGRQLLIYSGVHASRIAVTHAAWSAPEAKLEDRLVALADKLWKGKRDEALEAALVDELAAASGRARWDVFTAFDAVAEEIAAAGPERLARSVV